VTGEGPRLAAWPAGYAVRGVDASSPEPWASLRASGVRFAFSQVAIGTRLNEHFAANWRASKACGLRRAAYHFLSPRADGAAQAALFLAQLGDDRGELPPVVDVELPPGCKGPCCEVTPAGWSTVVRAWIDAVRRADHREPTLYTVDPFWKECLDNSSRLANHRLWLAGYPRFDLAPRPGFGGWQRWEFYQFKGNARVGGGVVDLNVFRGSEADFDALVAASAPP
jgi:lysozyme